MTYKTFEHTADLGLVIEAPDKETLFAEAARALLSVIVENPDEVRPMREVTITVEGTELDYLLFDWLNELLFHFEHERLLLAEFDIHFHQEGMAAKARGETLDCNRHELSHEVKAITYHQLEVREKDDGWSATVIVDI